MAIQTGVNVSNLAGFAVLRPPVGALLTDLAGFAVLKSANVTPPAWGSWAFPAGFIDTPYEHAWDMPGAADPITYSVLSGTLPDGLDLDDQAGTAARIYGTPTVAGVFSFTLRAVNSAGTVDKAFSITITDPGYPAESDVRAGVDYKGGEYTGTLALPAEADVKDGVTYGADGTEFEGTLTGGGSPKPHGWI